MACVVSNIQKMSPSAEVLAVSISLLVFFGTLVAVIF